MVFLFNILPVLIATVFLYLTVYVAKQSQTKMVVGVLGALMLAAYFQAQPSYLPKGTTKAPTPVAEFVVPDVEMSDRIAKPKTSEERDSNRKAEYEASEQRRQDFLKSLKEDK